MNICKKAQDLPPFIVMDVMERAQVLAREGQTRSSTWRWASPTSTPRP